MIETGSPARNTVLLPAINLGKVFHRTIVGGNGTVSLRSGEVVYLGRRDAAVQRREAFSNMGCSAHCCASREEDIPKHSILLYFSSFFFFFFI